MADTRWLVQHPDDQLGAGGLIEYPTEDAARAHAGTAGSVWALVPVEHAAVLDAAFTWAGSPEAFATDELLDAIAITQTQEQQP